MGTTKVTRSGRISLKIPEDIAYIWAIAATCRIQFGEDTTSTRLTLMEAIISLRKYGNRKALRPSELACLLEQETISYIDEPTQLLLKEIADDTQPIIQLCENHYTGLLPGRVG